MSFLIFRATVAHAVWSEKIPVQGVILDLPDRDSPIGGSVGIDWDISLATVSFQRSRGSFGPVLVQLHLPGRVKEKSNSKSCDWEKTYSEYSSKLSTLDPRGQLEFTIPLAGTVTRTQFVCLSSSGESTHQNLVVRFPTLKRFLASQPSLKPRRLSGQLGMGLSWIDFFDFTSGIKSTYQSLSTTLTGGLNYWAAYPKWMASLSGYLTMFPVTRTSSEDSSEVRFLGLNARFGYNIQKIREPWGLTLSGGFYYVTTFVNTQSFGFQNIGGPQLYPFLRYIKKSGDIVSSYLKISPVASRLSLLTLSSREMALGIHYTLSRQALRLGLDLSELTLKIVGRNINENYEMITRTASLGVSKSF